MIKVYHTSLQKVSEPDTKHSRSALDFGKGFYLTSIEEQARRYASRFIDRKKTVWLNEYELSEEWDKWNVKVFEKYNDEWLDFVASCRLDKDTSNYDMVIGGVADDRVFDTVDSYFAGYMSKEVALERLMFVHPNVQYCIRNEKMLQECLTYKQSIQL